MVANNMILETIPINKLRLNEGQIEGLPQNPRFIKKEKYQKLLQSIKEDPEMLELRELGVIPFEDYYVIFAGNMRYQAMKELGYTEALCKVAPKDTPPKKLRAYAIKDNLPYGEDDWEKLGNEWDKDELIEWGMTIDWDEEKLDENYSQKLGEVIYEPKETNHKISDLYQPETKFDQEIDKLQNEELKALLKARVYNFYEFNYAKIADYYAYQATPEEQKVIESLALVLLDKDKLIENGFSEIIESITKDEKPNSET